MGSATFPTERINTVAAVSCAIWMLVSLVVQLASRTLWPAYSKVLSPAERRQWCNKIACGLHAAVLSTAQARNLMDPVLNADPLHAVTDSHFFWGAVLLGYLVYDTAYSLAFFSLRSGAVMLAHHLVGIAGCVIGVYANKLALFGMAIEVFFESCNPLLHVLGCMKIAGRAQSRAYRTLSKLFVGQFFLFRVAISNGYFLWLLSTVLRLEQAPWWAWAGVAVFGLLNTLNAVWLFKLVKMVARNERRAQGTMAGAAPSKLEAAAAEGKPADAKATVRLTASSRQTCS
ncbi:hypothetical protein COHA_003594 [Chlorella ohadii]|uniref:TLC domain-containing protein n=1 Tax=Chlorella ohadii TaxID=2649997 RepID=A0AAD5DYP0_9CHLO|nr:hypothetical protein COHA_003594 [Chlorella ohadii]